MDRGWKAKGTVPSPIEQLKVILLGSKRIPRGRSDQVFKIMLKNQSVIILLNLASDQRALHSDSNGVNDTQIRTCMQKLKQVNVQV